LQIVEAFIARQIPTPAYSGVMKEIKDKISKQGIIGKNAIPEEYDLLRTIQMTINGYYKIV